MILSLFYLIAALVILGVLWWAMQTLIALVPMAEPFPTLIRVVLVVVMVIIVLWVLFQLLTLSGLAGGGMPSFPKH